MIPLLSPRTKCESVLQVVPVMILFSEGKFCSSCWLHAPPGTREKNVLIWEENSGENLFFSYLLRHFFVLHSSAWPRGGTFIFTRSLSFVLLTVLFVLCCLSYYQKRNQNINTYMLSLATMVFFLLFSGFIFAYYFRCCSTVSSLFVLLKLLCFVLFSLLVCLLSIHMHYY